MVQNQVYECHYSSVQEFMSAITRQSQNQVYLARCSPSHSSIVLPHHCRKLAVINLSILKTNQASISTE